MFMLHKEVVTPELVKSASARAAPKAVRGVLEGLACEYNVRGPDGIILRPGVFADAGGRVRAGLVPLTTGHPGDLSNIVGRIVQARDEKRGLKVRARFANTKNAKAAYKLVLAGHVGGLRALFRPVEHNRTRDGKAVEVHKATLFGVMLTVLPDTAGAVVTEAKGVGSKSYRARLDALAEGLRETAPLAWLRYCKGRLK